jgi:hypothetical protein
LDRDELREGPRAHSAVIGPRIKEANRLLFDLEANRRVGHHDGFAVGVDIQQPVEHPLGVRQEVHQPPAAGDGDHELGQVQVTVGAGANASARLRRPDEGPERRRERDRSAAHEPLQLLGSGRTDRFPAKPPGDRRVGTQPAQVVIELVRDRRQLLVRERLVGGVFLRVRSVAGKVNRPPLARQRPKRFLHGSETRAGSRDVAARRVAADAVVHRTTRQGESGLPRWLLQRIAADDRTSQHGQGVEAH